jgi:hypothetical protein
VATLSTTILRWTAGLDLDSGVKSLLALLDLLVGLLAHDATTPVSAVLIELVCVALVDGADQLLELVLVLAADLGECDDSSGLLVHDGTETRLALNYGIGDTHLAAEGGQEDDELDGVDVIGDENEGSLLVLNQSDDVVETVLDGVGLLGGVFFLLAIGHSGGFGVQTLLLLRFGLGAVLVEELERLCSCVAVECGLELGNRGRNLQAHVEDLALALEANVLWPSERKFVRSWSGKELIPVTYLTMRDRLRGGWTS